jgi:predicted CopG family antitoxin
MKRRRKVVWVGEDLWKELMHMKVETGARSMDELLRMLLERAKRGG